MIIAKVEEIPMQASISAEQVPLRVHLRCKDGSFFAINWNWPTKPEVGTWYRFQYSETARVVESIGDLFQGAAAPIPVEPGKPDSKFDLLWDNLVRIMKLMVGGYKIVQLNPDGVPISVMRQDGVVAFNIHLTMKRPQD